MLYYVSSSEITGKMAHSIQQMRMCAAFARQGQQVCFVHPAHGRSVCWDDIADYYGLETRFEIEDVPTVEGFLNSVPYAELLSTSVSLAGTLFSKLLTGAMEPSDIVYCRDYYGAFVFNELLRLIPEHKRPILAFEHHDIISARMKRRFYPSIDAVIPITHALESYGIDTFGISPENTFVAPDGVDIDPYEGKPKRAAREELNLPIDRTIVMYTGHLYPGKGVNVLVRAASSVDGLVYVVGGHESDIERVQSSFDVPENVVFTGFVQPASIPSYQLAADVLVAPYTNESRDFISPLKLFEYMAAGRPIVATSRSVLKEVLTDGENALLAEPGDSHELAVRINDLVRSEELREEIASSARDTATEYTWDERAKSILEFLGVGSSQS
ncbi:glycosyltransferase family 4 protein [Halobaculum sp. MBLA0147]|uniref:glycosyltransferase family 4 protein n=1 Tax=Halobaculum sp. MBLA0147 TaxID=3079934 RepID=UPI003526A1DD